ncbi:MAG TPA: hypothetical protein VJ827_10770 [Rubrobacter sp.]|nr:hypothetical protein [Rubrobacter sp.]
MIKVSLEVREGRSPFRVEAQAESIGQAMSIVKGHYPGREVRVVFPIDSEEFFIKDRERIGAEEAPSRSMELSYGRPEGLDRTEAGGVDRMPVSGGE